jgi:hypothetical protein
LPDIKSLSLYWYKRNLLPDSLILLKMFNGPVAALVVRCFGQMTLGARPSHPEPSIAREQIPRRAA